MNQKCRPLRSTSKGYCTAFFTSDALSLRTCKFIQIYSPRCTPHVSLSYQVQSFALLYTTYSLRSTPTAFLHVHNAPKVYALACTPSEWLLASYYVPPANGEEVQMQRRVRCTTGPHYFARTPSVYVHLAWLHSHHCFALCASQRCRCKE